MTAGATATRRWNPPVPEDRRRAVVGAATGVAALAVVGRFLVTALVNAPSGAALGVEPVAAGATAVAALAAVGLALTERDPAAGVGLLFVGVFGLLSLATPAVAAPAAVAVVAGTAAVAVAHRDRLANVRGVVVGALLVALAVSLAGGVGGVVGLRRLGSTLALAAVAASPAFAAPSARSLLGGGVAAAAVVAAGLSLPFVVGAVTLVGGGVVGAPLPVVALAAGGATTAASAAVRRREWPLLAGVALLAFAGVPAALPRAVPFALGVAALALREARR
ncbi:hypothetical protein [Haloplanus halophilus]|uniref:hypothetical protein n=1 Tax=Haloplanus halophilus TaxID=2949993 RepID=UPI00203A4E3F|nr:hypothetical protein [Haloplanus sp. GDY1]